MTLRNIESKAAMLRSFADLAANARSLIDPRALSGMANGCEDIQKMAKRREELAARHCGKHDCEDGQSWLAAPM